jgi:hypothetical protein
MMITIGDWDAEDLACAGMWRRGDRFEPYEVRERHDALL